MSDPWQYRVRVTGPDRDAWWEKAIAGSWGSGLISWPMLGRFGSGATFQAGGTWYNVRVRKHETEDGYDEFLGNFSGAPKFFFAAEDCERWREGPAMFDGLDITVEIIGHSWHSDSPTGIYSYRDVYERGVLLADRCETADNSSIAEKYAPELLVEFPDDYTPEERVEMAAERAEEDHPEEAAKRIVAQALDQARKGSIEQQERCSHGIPFEDPNRDNGCKACASELRNYLNGLVKRPIG